MYVGKYVGILDAFRKCGRLHASNLSKKGNAIWYSCCRIIDGFLPIDVVLLGLLVIHACGHGIVGSSFKCDLCSMAIFHSDLVLQRPLFGLL